METQKIVEEFLNEKSRNAWKFLFKDELYDCERKFDKQFLDFDVDELLYYFSVIKMSGKNLTTLSQISTVKSKLKNFINWCIKKGYTNKNVISENKKALLDEIILKYINPKDMVLYTPEEINKICSKLRSSRDGVYLEGIVRALYEGVPNILKFIELKYCDLDAKNNILDLGDYKLPISNELKKAFIEVHNKDSIVLEGVVKDVEYRLEDLFGSLYKFPTRTDITWENDKKTYYAIAKVIHSSRFAAIEEIIGSEMNEEILRNSYLFKHLLAYADGNVDYVSKLINCEDTRETEIHINKAMSKAKCQYTAKEIRKLLLPYFISR